MKRLFILLAIVTCLVGCGKDKAKEAFMKSCVNYYEEKFKLKCSPDDNIETIRTIYKVENILKRKLEKAKDEKELQSVFKVKQEVERIIKKIDAFEDKKFDDEEKRDIEETELCQEVAKITRTRFFGACEIKYDKEIVIDKNLLEAMKNI